MIAMLVAHCKQEDLDNYPDMKSVIKRTLEEIRYYYGDDLTVEIGRETDSEADILISFREDLYVWEPLELSRVHKTLVVEVLEYTHKHYFNNNVLSFEDYIKILANGKL